MKSKHFLKYTVCLCTAILCSSFTTQAETSSNTPSLFSKSTITYKDKIYHKKQNITTTLVIGVDNVNNTQEETEDSLGDSGMADCLLLAVMDTDKEETTVIGINRDTMTQVDLLDVNGEYFRTARMQIALSHGYGDGKEQSCENTVKSVENLLEGITVDSYAALKMAAIPILNDAVGGVNVEILDDLQKADKDFVKDSVLTLKGGQALTYVKWRDTEELDSNEARMSRQKQYIGAFAEQVKAYVDKDITKALTLYDTVEEYTVTDMKMPQMVDALEQFEGTSLEVDSIRFLPGKLTKGKEYAEYEVNQEALRKMVLDIFYELQ